jgi:glucose-6-phosphate 1-dehydrogenase
MSDKLNDISSRIKGRIIQKATESCDIDIPEPFCLVIFGASGDLTRRKIIPSIYRLDRLRLLPEDFFVLGTARTAISNDDFRDTMKDDVREACPEEFSESSWREFAKRLYYFSIDYYEVGTYKSLKEHILPLEKKHRTAGNRIFYMATPPTVLEAIVNNIGEAGLAVRVKGYTHIVIEKPFGRDIESASSLNAILKDFFDERQIYRRYIDHIQITVSETLGVEHRAGYYEKAGVIRDMFQNHLLQLFALTAMEAPSVFEADRVRDEKVKVFRSVRPFPLDRIDKYVVIGQYGKGEIDKKEVVAYRDEPNVSHDSTTPTYAAMKVFIDNWRWNGVPFYLRSGKRLSTQKAEISIHYKPVPHMMFANAMEEDIEPNTLILRVQPDEGIRLIFQAKNPGSKLCLNSVLMDFSYQKVFMLGAYERVLLDCMQGDQMLFVRADGVEQTWVLLTPMIEKLESEAKKENFPNYPSGTSGTVEAAALIERDGRRWRPL